MTSPPKEAEFLDQVLGCYRKVHKALRYYSMLIQALNIGSISATIKAWGKDLNLAFHEMSGVLRDVRVRLI